ncbi:MAG: hypothetical protein HY906_15850 [Deltaproteobacteria bacterium]|nr:hypothetical protein [Deltaproteobacteria bacterium]
MRRGWLAVGLAGGLLLAGLVLGACGQPPRLVYPMPPDLDGFLPPRPRPPRVETVEPAAAPAAPAGEVVTVRLPDFRDATLGLLLFQGGVGGSTAMAPQALMQRLRLRLTFRLLGAGMTRFVDLSLVESVRAGVADRGGARLEGPLDPMLLLARVARADYLLRGISVEAKVVEERVRLPRRVVAEDLERYRAEEQRFRDRWSSGVGNMNDALRDFYRQSEQALKEFRAAWAKTPWYTRAGAAVGADELRQAAQEGKLQKEVAAVEARARALRAEGAAVLPAGEVESRARETFGERVAKRHRVELALVLNDVAAGQTVWAGALAGEARTIEAAVDALVRSLVRRSRLKPSPPAPVAAR